jgi:hypothetical protein
MEEIKKLLETWKTEKGSFIPNAHIYGEFIKELEDTIKKQEKINKLTIPVVSKSVACENCNGWNYTTDENGRRKNHCRECE